MIRRRSQTMLAALLLDLLRPELPGAVHPVVLIARRHHHRTASPNAGWHSQSRPC